MPEDMTIDEERWAEAERRMAEIRAEQEKWDNASDEDRLAEAHRRMAELRAEPLEVLPADWAPPSSNEEKNSAELGWHVNAILSDLAKLGWDATTVEDEFVYAFGDWWRERRFDVKHWAGCWQATSAYEISLSEYQRRYAEEMAEDERQFRDGENIRPANGTRATFCKALSNLMHSRPDVFRFNEEDLTWNLVETK